MEEPKQMKAPEQRARNGVVVDGPAAIQEAQHMLIHEIKPEEAAVIGRGKGLRIGAEGEIDVRRILQRRQDVPWQRDGQRDEDSTERVESRPGAF